MKRTLTSIAAAALVLGAMSPAAFAASTANNAAKVVGTKAVVVDGTTISNPYELTAVDSGNTTAYFGVHYFDQALTKAGFTSSWDGNTHTWAITAPGVDASKVKFDSTGSVGTGNTSITINGVVVKKINTFSHVDPADNTTQTTYFPVFYVNNLLAALGVGGSWDAAAGLNVKTAELSVVSASALNADQIQVVFNKPVDTTSAQTIGNYTLNGAPLAGSDAAVVAADGRTVVLTLNTTAKLVTTKGYALGVNGVKSVDGTQTVSNYLSSAFLFAGDTTPATVNSVASKASKSTTTVTVTYSEPVSGTGLYYINGAAASVASNANGVVTLTAPSALAAGSTNSLQIINETDTSGNYTSLTQNFTVVADTVAPVITSVTPVSDNKIHVVFSKPINTATFQDTTNLKFFDASFTNITTDITAVTPSDSTDTAFDLTLGAGAKTSFNGSGQLVGVLQFGSAIADQSGNTLTAVNKDITLTLNKTVPAVTSEKYVVPGTSYESNAYANGAVVLTFNEPVAAGNVSSTYFNATTDKGVVDTATIGSFTATAGTATNEVILVPATKFSGTNTETVSFLPGAFTDSSLSGNKSTATFTQTFNLTSGVGSTASDTTAPVISNLAVGAHAANATETITFKVTEAESLDYSSVLNTANYRLNNAALPAGAYITTDGASPATGTVVTINLPVGSIASNGTYSVTILGIKDTAGNVATTAISNAITLTDNTAPKLTGAVDNADQSISLSFSEPVTGLVPADLSVSINGANALASTAYTVTAGTGADAGKWVLKLNAAPTKGDSIAVTVNSSATGADAAGNPVAAGGTATVTSN